MMRVQLTVVLVACFAGYVIWRVIGGWHRSRVAEIRAMAIVACKSHQESSAAFPSMEQCVAWNFRVTYDSVVLGKQPMEATGPIGPTR